MKGGNFAKKYVVKLIQERWFLNFTFHKGTCIVRRASRLHFYRVFLVVRSNFHWSVRQEFIQLMTHFLILMVILIFYHWISMVVSWYSFALHCSFFQYGGQTSVSYQVQGLCQGVLLSWVITFYPGYNFLLNLDHWGKCVFTGLAIKGYEPLYHNFYKVTLCSFSQNKSGKIYKILGMFS